MSKPRVRLDAIIDVLREAESDNGRTPTVSQMSVLIDDIWQMLPLWVTAARPEMSGLSEATLLSAAERFGKHRAQAMKRDLVGKRTREDALAAEMLLPPTEDEVREARQLLADGIQPYRMVNGKPRMNTASRTNPKGFPKRLFHALAVAENDWGTIPLGYDRTSEHGRDIHGSLAAVLAQPATEPEIIRFVDRSYSMPTVALHADHVQVFHWLVSHGLETKLLDLVNQTVDIVDGVAVLATGPGQSNLALAKTMVAAYDLLEVARLDAMRALGRVVRGDVEELEAMRAELAKCQWLAPATIGRLAVTAERYAEAPGSARLGEIFESSVRTFRHTVTHRPDSVVVRSVAQMTSAHLAQVLALSGMEVDDGEEKAASVELRTRLIEMGLRKDLDRELPEALRAWHAGRLEEFYASRQARLEGDPDWARLYTGEV